jgi:hypothetical protein
MRIHTLLPAAALLGALASTTTNCIVYTRRPEYQPAPRATVVATTQPVAQAVVVAQPAYAGGTLALGSTVTGILQAGDTLLNDGSVGDDYAITLGAGQTVTIVTRGGPSYTSPGSRLDVYTLVMLNGSEVTHDDDSAGNLNSRIIFTAPVTATYIIRVTTFGAGLRQGEYSLTVMPGANPYAS